MKETLESILVAFILAFVFRAFVVEAFVIPTGSMAPTLLGAHMRFRCNDCGYRFDTNYTAPQSKEGDLLIGSKSETTYNKLICPNCGYRFPTYDPLDPDNDAAHPPVHYGDRILVLKYIYLLHPPQRWDVVVFKSPDLEPNRDPPTYTQNYIKRLVGRPGESIMILDGDIYVGQPSDDVNNYTIQTKPKPVQDALWRVIYDNDYHPRALARSDGSTWKQPWVVRDGSGWELQAKDDSTSHNGRTFRFDNAAGESTIYFDRKATPGNFPFTDWLAYDLEAVPADNVTHDLKISFAYTRSAGDGPLRVKLGSGDDHFVAVITPTAARLVHQTQNQEKPIGAPFAMPSGNEPIQIELTTVDYEVTLRVNGAVAARTTPAEYKPDIKALLDAYNSRSQYPWPTVQISAANQTSSINHLGLWRDIYYNHRGRRPDGSLFAGMPDNIMRLKEDEFFVLGDNSLISGDGRFWQTPVNLPADQLQAESGRVPGRFLLGKAFFVYWPAGFRPVAWGPGLAPNFGDMRFIR